MYVVFAMFSNVHSLDVYSHFSFLSLSLKAGAIFLMH